MYIFAAFALLFAAVSYAATNSTCRSQPGDPSFPTPEQFSQFNTSIGGRLIVVVPAGEFCQEQGGCNNTEWNDPLFKANIPGAMDAVNWEQDYSSVPPSICFRNTTPCGQGHVPLYAVNATSVADIQAGVLFAQAHNLKVAVKASGHDYLGRSTAKNSFMLWTRYLDTITFHDNFKVGDQYMGSAMTVGSGVGMSTMYQAAKAKGMICVGGSALNVVAAGGYLQGAGHSALSPTFGLGADNTLEFQVVLANGTFVTVNEVSNSNLFWAMRGGGPGSWGVIISATIRTFPTFDSVRHQAIIGLNTSTEAAQLAQLHANHIFDWDAHNASQYFYLLLNPPGQSTVYTWLSISLFPNTTFSVANASLTPFMDAVAAEGFDIASVTTEFGNVNDILSQPSISDKGAVLQVLGSRLVPIDVYRNNITAIGNTYKQLLDAGCQGILGNLIAGGQVSRNADINSAVNPKWRTAKAHVILLNTWTEETSADDVESIREQLTDIEVPILEALAGPGSGSYSNEADVREPNFQTTFFGPNYQRLSSIKEAYDPDSLFIVGAGVGSEHWDTDGLCRID